MPKLFGSYPFGSDKQKVQDLPDPGGSGGGTDEQLSDAADALSPDTADTYAPPVPPTPRSLTLPDDQKPPESTVWLFNPPAALPGLGSLIGGGQTDHALGFPIQSVRVDNFTRQWVYFPEEGKWIPPLWIGAVFRVNGQQRARVTFETPAGLTALTLSTTEVARVVWSNEVIAQEVDGEQIPSGVVSGVLGAVAIAGDAGQAQTQAYSADSLSQTLLGLITNARLQAWNPTTSAVDRLRISLATGLAQSNALLVAAAYGDGSNMIVPKNAGNIGDAGAGAFNAQGIFAATGASGSVWDRVRTAKVFKTFGPLAINASSVATVWTPATGLKPRLMGFLVNMTSAASADGQVLFFDNTTTGAVMAATGWMTNPNSVQIAVPHSIRLDNGPICATSSNVIVAYCPVATNIAGMVFGTEE